MQKNTYLTKFTILLLFLISLGLGSCREKVANGFPQTNLEEKDGNPTSQPETLHPDCDQRIAGEVIKIADGDSFTMRLDNGSKIKVRLFGIDAPERRQAFSNVARKSLSDLIFEKNILVFYDEKDVFGRILGVAYVGNTNINQEQVRTGMAWHFKRYSDDAVLAKLEDDAKVNHRGLWQDSQPVAPWIFRKRSKD